MLGGINLYQYAPNGLTWIDPWGLCRRGNKATKDHMDKVRDKFTKDNPNVKHTDGGRDALNGKELPERYLKPRDGGRKGGSYADMTFETSGGKTVHVQTVDKGGKYGMSQREWNNAERITRQDPKAIVITVPKGSTPSAGSLDISTMKPGTINRR